MTPNELHATAERALHLCRTAAPHIANRETMRLLRPLAEAALSAFDIYTQCKIAFAEMFLAWNDYSQDWPDRHEDFLSASEQFNLRRFTPELLADMQRVTRELASK